MANVQGVIMLCCVIQLYFITTNNAALTSWSVHNGMKKALSNQIAGYDILTNKIWIFGGHNNSLSAPASHTYFEFDTNSNSFIEYHNKSIISQTAGSQSYVVIDDTIYTYFADHIQFFNMRTQTLINKTDTYISNRNIINPCMATYGKRYIMIIGGVEIFGTDCKTFNTVYIYDLFEQQYLTMGPPLNVNRSSPACLVGSDNFLYVFGGFTYFTGAVATDIIERINITNIENIYDNASWEVLQTSKLTTPRGAMGVIENKGYIYIIGGEITGFYQSADVDVFDINSQNITSGVSLPTPAKNFAITGDEKYIYLFGGANSQNACTAEWKISNNLLNDENNNHTFWIFLWSWKGLVIMGCAILLVIVIIGRLIWRCKSQHKHNICNVQDDELLSESEDPNLSPIIQK